MTQNASDVEIANQGFAAFRQDLNDVLEDITTLHSGTAAPSTTYANQWWYETDTDKLYIRNEDNDAWVEILTIDQANDHLASLGATITLDGSGNASIDGTFDVNGNELILDADGDTSITADTDDRIDLRAGGSDIAYVNGSGVGVGVTPSHPLHIYRSSAGTVAEFRSNDGTNNPRFSIYGDSSGTHLHHTWSSGADALIFEVGGSAGSNEKMRILNGGGITFNGDTAAANALDDYEEGTWTPTISGATAIQITGTYVKIGNLCYVGGFIQWPSTSDTTGITIGNFPFTCKDDNDSRAGLCVSYSTRSVFTSILMTNNANTATLRNLGGSIPTNADFSARVIHFGGVYETA